MIIYEIRNKTNNKVYVGKYSKCNTNKEFLQTNYWGSGVYIKRAIKKYSIENFERNVIVENITDKEELNYLEIQWIKNKNSKHPNGYNLTDGGEGVLNPSDELKTKMSLSASATYQNGRMAWHKNKKMSIEYKKAHSGKIPWNKGKTEIFTKKTLELMSKNKKGKSKSTETKNKMAISKKQWWKLQPNRQLSEQQKEKISFTLNHRILKRTYILKNILTKKVFKINSGFGLFCKEKGLNKNKLYQILKGNGKTHKGWVISIEK